MHKNFSRSDIDVLTNLSYVSKVVECHFNYVVNMKRSNDKCQFFCMLKMVVCCVFVDGYTFKQLHLHAIRLIQFCILFCQSPNFKFVDSTSQL